MNEKTKKLIEIRQDLCNSFVVDREAIDKLANLRWKKMKNFRQYSWANTVMAAHELKARTGNFPELLGSFPVWKKVGRYPRKGQKGLIILFPMKSVVMDCPICKEPTFGKKNIAKGCRKCGYEFSDEDLEEIKGFTTFKPGYVWDLSQTDGEPIDFNDELLVNRSNYRFNNLRLHCSYPIRYTAKTLEKGATDGRTIWISIKSNEAGKISTLAHEMAHIKLNHVNSDKPRGILELEAESVAYMVTSAMGIQNHKAASYIDGWCRDNPAGKIQNGDYLLKIAEEILEELEVDF